MLARSFAALAAAALIASCSKSPEPQAPTIEQPGPQQSSTQRPSDDQKAGETPAGKANEQLAAPEHARKEADEKASDERALDEKAWSDAVRVGTAAAFTSYLRAFGTGAHASEARDRVAALEAQARKKAAADKADNKAWADALRANNAAAFTSYLQSFASGAHAADARRRIAALEEEARKKEADDQADNKAWAEASGAGTQAAFTAYLQKFGSGIHAADARRRVVAFEVQARKEADDKAWAEATRVGTTSAFTSYLTSFGSGAQVGAQVGAHVGEARRQLAALEVQERRVPVADIRKTCRDAAAVTVSLLGNATTEQTINICLDSEQKAREQIVKDRATFSSVDVERCLRPTVYLPSYVEWLTCLEMERDVRKMQQERQEQRQAGAAATVGSGSR